MCVYGGAYYILCNNDVSQRKRRYGLYTNWMSQRRAIYKLYLKRKT